MGRQHARGSEADCTAEREQETSNSHRITSRPPLFSPTLAHALALRAPLHRRPVAYFDNPPHYLAEGGILVREHRAHAHLEQRLAIAAGNYPAHHEPDVARATFLEQRDRLASDRKMGPGERAYREHFRVFLERRLDHLRRRLLETRQDHFHPGLHAGVREQLDRVDMTVQPGLAQRDADAAGSVG